MSKQAPGYWTKFDLMQIARHQKNLIWMIPISFATILIPLASLVVGIIQLYFIYRLSIAVRSKVEVLYIILAFLPLLGLLGLLHLNGKANRRLQTNGIKVGLLGARMSDFEMIQ